jgi:hypothetical protein
MRTTIEKNFIDWENHVFGFGYGTGERYTIGALKNFLAEVPSRGAYDYVVLNAAVGADVAWLLINILCRHDIIEYGTSPRYGWLTPQGTALKEFILSRSLDDLEKLACEATEGNDYCAPDCCNCGPKGYEEGRRCPNPFWKTR